MSSRAYLEQARELVMRDLVDVLIQENLFSLCQRRNTHPPPGLIGHGVRPGEEWYRVDLADGWIAWRVEPAAALQPYRFSRGGVWAGHDSGAFEPRVVTPDELLAILLAQRVSDPSEVQVDGPGPGPDVRDCVMGVLPGGRAVVNDLRTAVEHAAVTLAARQRIGACRPKPGAMVPAERLAATRDRPFHPTARATVGWDTAERERYGPMRSGPLGLAWVAVRRDRLRYGSGPGSDRLHAPLLDQEGQERLREAMRLAGVDAAEYQPLPVHPWQFQHVLPVEYADELTTRDVLPITPDLGRYLPTASIRTLATDPEGPHHVKLPLGIATLGATRLLPPRYLENGERGQQTMAEIIDRSEPLRELVAICDERVWCGWGGEDEYANRPGQLTAQLRRYPDGLLDDPELLVLPMAALAAHEWDLLSGALDVEPVAFFGALADAFCLVGLGFLGYGVLPELHGQNVVVGLRGGTVARVILRDHDTVRIYPAWMDAAGLAHPGYRIKTGAAQSLCLPSGEALLGYLQTLGFQVNLYGIADALARRYRVAETVFWARLRAGVDGAVERLELPGHVTDVVTRELLDAREWPCRQVFGPLLRRGVSREVSMPAEVGIVPNPLSTPADPAPVAPTTGRVS
ncbi:MAG TPA: IucA/IucC family protein [Pseudonocardiaceae bacterium]|nr:IucA/IucC family protein [Pseudonocardiaceae bacterium]